MEVNILLLLLLFNPHSRVCYLLILEREEGGEREEKERERETCLLYTSDAADDNRLV